MFFQLIYRLLFTIEQVSTKLVALEFCFVMNLPSIRLDLSEDDPLFYPSSSQSSTSDLLCPTPGFSLRWKGSVTPDPPIPYRMLPKKWLDLHSLNLKQQLRSYLPSAILKCAYYAFSTKDIISNLIALRSELACIYPRILLVEST